MLGGKGKVVLLRYAEGSASTNEREDGFLEANVEYLRKDGKTVTIPAVTVLERNGDLVKSLRIYFDVAPVYA